MKFKNSKLGFTLIELLVVIGILAVLAAIAIPSVAGLIDRANVSADATNANEMTNAFERFASEYELFRQDLSSGTFKKEKMDTTQSRVYNVLKVENRTGIEAVEVDDDATVTEDQIAIFRDTKYPANAKTAKAIIQNYTKTSSSTFEPKQSDKHFWYSPDCGVVVVADPNSSVAQRNELIVSGMDAKGNALSETTGWIDLTTSYSGSRDATDDDIPYIKFGVPYTELNTGKNSIHYYFYENGSAEIYENNELSDCLNAGEILYDGEKIIVSDEDGIFFTVSNDGKNLYIDGELFATEGKPFPLKFGKPYAYYSEKGIYSTTTFYADGSFVSVSGDNIASWTGHAGTLEYDNATRNVYIITIEDGIKNLALFGTVSPDSKQFTWYSGEVATVTD